MNTSKLMGRESMYPWAVPIMERIVADKEEQRRINALKPWHEKIADIERMNEAIRIGREGLHKTPKADAARKSAGHSADAAQPPERNPWRRPAASCMACARIVASRAGRRPSGAQLVAQTGRRLAMSPAHQRGVPVSSQASMQSAHIQQ